jgi:hypothetical protein
MEWKSTFFVNAAAYTVSLTSIKNEVQIAVMIVGIIWTLIQCAQGVANLIDRKWKIDRAKRIRKLANKRKKDDKKLQKK